MALRRGELREAAEYTRLGEEHRAGGDENRQADAVGRAFEVDPEVWRPSLVKVRHRAALPLHGLTGRGELRAEERPEPGAERCLPELREEVDEHLRGGGEGERRTEPAPAELVGLRDP